jgi:predicted small metal-binding protein
MAKFSFECKDIGVQCNARVDAEDKKQLMQKISEHAKSAHNMQNIDKDTMKKIERAIKKA